MLLASEYIRLMKAIFHQYGIQCAQRSDRSNTGCNPGTYPAEHTDAELLSKPGGATAQDRTGQNDWFASAVHCESQLFRPGL